MRYDADWRHYPPPRGYDRGYREQGEVRDRFPHDWRQLPVGRDYPSGVTEPETTGVHGPARYGLGPYHERLRRRRRSDDELRENVTEALFYDTWVDADAITVHVQEGVVTLRGELASYDEIRFATDDAWDVEGVLGVRTELRVADG